MCSQEFSLAWYITKGARGACYRGCWSVVVGLVGALFQGMMLGCWCVLIGWSFDKMIHEFAFCRFWLMIARLDGIFCGLENAMQLED